MNGFAKGFQKVAAGASLLEGAASAAKKIGIGATRVAKGAVGGAGEAMKGTIGDALKLKGLSHLSDAYKTHGVGGLKTKAGQKAWGEAIGKAAPSLAAGGAYAAAGKKIYDKTLGSNKDQASAGYYY
jgi:hypothetical protein